MWISFQVEAKVPYWNAFRIHWSQPVHSLSAGIPRWREWKMWAQKKST
ncbi:MAG: hypothetical protein WCB19_03980 [Thermoplasmata archaeon]